MNNNLLTSLKKYLAAKNDPYAILLAGGWGNGKTHFLQNDVKRLAGDLKKRVIYLSLFGIENKDEFERMLFIRTLSSTEGKTGGFIAMGMKYLQERTKTSAKDVLRMSESLTEDTLLIVDDLERASGIEVIISILASLVNLVHENNLKVIVVANEDELLKLEKSEKYTSWKEKIIRYTYKYSIDANGVLNIVTGELNNVCANHIDGDRARKLIENAIKNTSCYNLRTYLRSVAQFAGFVDVLKDEQVFSMKVREDLLQTILALNIEYSESPKSKSALKAAFDGSLIHLAFSGDSSERNDVTKFLRRHFGARQQGLVKLPQVLHAVLDGVWDEESLKKSFREEYAAKERKPEELLLGDFRSLSDDEFSTATEKLLDRISAAKFSHAGEVLFFNDALFYFAKSGLIPIGTGTLRSTLESCINKLPKGAFLGNIEEYSQYSLYGVNSFQNEDHRGFVDFFKEKWEKHATERVREIKNSFIRELNSDIEPMVEALYSLSSEINRQPIFEEQDAAPIVDALRKMQSSSIIKFEHALLDRYKGGQISSRFAQEKNFVKALIRLLEFAVKSDERRKNVSLSSHSLTSLWAELGGVLEGL